MAKHSAPQRTDRIAGVVLTPVVVSTASSYTGRLRAAASAGRHARS